MATCAWRVASAGLFPNRAEFTRRSFGNPWFVLANQCARVLRWFTSFYGIFIVQFGGFDNENALLSCFSNHRAWTDITRRKFFLLKFFSSFFFSNFWTFGLADIWLGSYGTAKPDYKIHGQIGQHFFFWVFTKLSKWRYVKVSKLLFCSVWYFWQYLQARSK